MRTATIRRRKTFSVLFSIWLAMTLATGLVGAMETLPLISSGTVPKQDTIAPSMPARVRLVSATQTSIELAWDKATDNTEVAGYRIYERVKLNPYYAYWALRLNNVTATSATLTGLQPGTKYKYGVSAFDAAGNESPKANAPLVTTLEAPHAYHPVKVGEAVFGVVGQLFKYQVAATGNPAPEFSLVEGPQGMTVNARTGLVTWTPSAVDAGQATATVRAFNSEGSDVHTFSFPVYTAGTDREAPSSIYDPLVSNITANGATISWQPATDNVGVIGYLVMAQKDGHGQSLFTAGDTSGPATIFTVTTLQAGTGYRLWISAYDAAGNRGSISGVPPAHITTLTGTVDVPISGLAATNSSPTLLGLPTLFTATVASGTNVNFVWEFDDGSGNTGDVISHTFAITGTHITTVTATNNQGSVTATTVAEVLAPPISNTNLISVEPPLPTNSDLITITVSGVYTNSCTPVYASHQLVDHVISIVGQLSGELFCLPVETAWSYAVQVGPLPTGTYTVLHTVGDVVDVATFIVVEAPVVTGQGVPPSLWVDALEATTLTAAVGELFTVQMLAVGDPPPTYTLMVAPSAMAIDPDTGIVTWIPAAQDVGRVDFAVRAENAAGSDDYAFSVTVAPAEPDGSNNEEYYLPIILQTLK
ncbi:MAG: fibronectin type III domain-containing protein [Caldilineaceae bacterium]|nr:fibronectin type III domain-containing protein [Caldilineaceae bacterium]